MFNSKHQRDSVVDDFHPQLTCKIVVFLPISYTRNFLFPIYSMFVIILVYRIYFRYYSVFKVLGEMLCISRFKFTS
jgi:hypothetical protein